MKNLSYYLLIIIVLIVFYFMIYDNETVSIQSTIDHEYYQVLPKKDNQVAANQLALLRNKLTTFVINLAQKYPTDKRVQRLKSKFNPKNLSEGNNNGKYTSYSINKGEKIVFCLRQKTDNHEIIDLNTITFVALHELSHVMSVSIGHKKEFWKNFKFLLNEAVMSGIYQYQAFHLKPQPYCGIKITNTPLGN